VFTYTSLHRNASIGGQETRRERQGSIKRDPVTGSTRIKQVDRGIDGGFDSAARCRLKEMLPNRRDDCTLVCGPL
jgi:hypothetical protein